MGLGFNETLMATLADYGMGHYAYLEHLAKLGEILEQDMANTRQVFASASSLELTVGDGVTVTDVGGYPIDLTSQPGTARVATGQLLGGAIITETVFAWPGVATLTVESIRNQDFPVVQCAVILLALVIVSLNLIVDLTVAFIDPRIRTGS